jgi:hypothetical protein
MFERRSADATNSVGKTGGFIAGFVHNWTYLAGLVRHDDVCYERGLFPDESQRRWPAGRHRLGEEGAWITRILVPVLGA